MNGTIHIDENGSQYAIIRARLLWHACRMSGERRVTRLSAISGSRDPEVVQQRLDAYALAHDFVAYPDVICNDCAERTGKRMNPGHIATFYPGICGICGILSTVTEPRDYGHWTSVEDLKALYRVAHEGG